MELMKHIFNEPFVQTGLITSLLLGSLCAFLGLFLILKRIVFVGAAVSQLAAMGVALGHLLGHSIQLSPDLMAFVFALTGVIIFWLPYSQKQLTKESWIGTVFAFASAAAILIIAKDPLAEAENLDLISGNLLFVDAKTIYILGGIVLGVSLLHYFFHKEFLLVSFDSDTARTLQIPARFYEFLLYLSLGVTVAVGIKVAGFLYVFSSLIVPAVIGLSLFRRLKHAALAAIFSMVLASVLGIYFSYVWDLPTAPTISTLNALFLLPLWILRWWR